MTDISGDRILQMSDIPEDGILQMTDIKADSVLFYLIETGPSTCLKSSSISVSWSLLRKL